MPPSGKKTSTGVRHRYRSHTKAISKWSTILTICGTPPSSGWKSSVSLSRGSYARPTGSAQMRRADRSTAGIPTRFADSGGSTHPFGTQPHLTEPYRHPGSPGREPRKLRTLVVWYRRDSRVNRFVLTNGVTPTCLTPCRTKHSARISARDTINGQGRRHCPVWTVMRDVLLRHQPRPEDKL